MEGKYSFFIDGASHAVIYIVMALIGTTVVEVLASKAGIEPLDLVNELHRPGIFICSRIAGRGCGEIRQTFCASAFIS